MNTFLKQTERNELLPKRWVFEADSKKPQESAPENSPTQSEKLRDKPVSQLQERLETARTELRAKMDRAKQLIPDLEGKNEQQQSTLAEEIKKLLDEIEANTQLRAEFSSDVYLVKIEVAKRLKGIFDKITWSMPSIEGVQTAFEGGSTWQNILKSGPLLMAHFKNLMYVFFGSGKAEAIKSAATQTPPATPNTPGNNPPQTPPAAPEKPKEQLDPGLVRLSEATIIKNGVADYSPGMITFSVPILGGRAVYRVSFDGNRLQEKKGDEFVDANMDTGQNLVVMKFLQQKREELRKISRLMEMNTSNAFQYPITMMTTSMILLQQKENQSNQTPKIDVVKELSEKWDAFKNHEKIKPMNAQALQKALLSDVENNAEEILKILRSLPVANTTIPPSPAGSFPPSGTGGRTS